jgi:hypothetical protein
MGTITTITVIKLAIKVGIFIGGIVMVIYLENLINKKPTLKRGGSKHESDSHSETIIH